MIDLPLVHAGKVRRLYQFPDGHLLMVATDSISSFDHVLDSEIPDKGAVLTQLSQWWLERIDDIVPHHVISADVPAEVAGRAVVCEPLDMIDVECVARGYLTGSGWTEYQKSQSVCGVPLPAGLQDGSRLPEPIFTPAAKASLGQHDENIDFATMSERVGVETAEVLRELTLAIYARAEEIARERGIIVADTKLEFGRRADGTIVLGDEALTPDSSRFWEAATWEPGGAQPSFDKQYVRDWLVHESGWDRSGDTPPPPLSPEVVEATRARYVEAYERITGQRFAANPELVDAPAPAGEPAADGMPGPAERPTDPVNPPVTAEVPSAAGDTLPSMARVIVDVMPKPEILDPQGKAVTGALQRMGFDGLTVRQGKRFEIEVDGDITDERLAQIEQAAETLLANTTIEAFDVRIETA